MRLALAPTLTSAIVLFLPCLPALGESVHFSDHQANQASVALHSATIQDPYEADSCAPSAGSASIAPFEQSATMTLPSCYAVGATDDSADAPGAHLLDAGDAHVDLIAPDFRLLSHGVVTLVPVPASLGAAFNVGWDLARTSLVGTSGADASLFALAASFADAGRKERDRLRALRW